ncbi:MAG: DUF3800 domain-containing protein [bacterium]|nr:DUF3800 domain-containing protein [bacterium]
MNPINENNSTEQRTRITFGKGRVFLFVDETGDPGHPSETSSSRYYQLNIAIVHREAMASMHKHLSAFRYFKDSGKELKKHERDAKLLAGVFEDLAKKNNVIFTSFILEKEKYTGPYLKKINENIFTYNPNKFRNFVVRRSFEYIFSKLILIDSENHNLEIVFDRYLDSEADEENLKKYLRGNYRLPAFEKIVQVDSEYSEAVQVSDFIGRFVKEYCFDGNENMTVDVFDFIRIFILENPDTICEKRPDTP